MALGESLADLEAETLDILPDLSIESNDWLAATGHVFRLRNNVVYSTQQEDPEITERHFDALLNACAKYLNDIPITNTLPNYIINERRDYRDLLIKTIDRGREEDAYVSGFGMIKHIEEVVSGVLDYAYGPEFGYMVLENLADPEFLEEEKRNALQHTSDYYISFEGNRDVRRARLRGRKIRGPIDKIAGYGRRGNFPVRALIYNINEYIQNKTHLVGRSEEEVGEIREQVEENFRDFVGKRKKLRRLARRKGRPREVVRKILLEDEDVLDMIVGEIKPRTPYDLIPGHPLQQKIRNMIREDKNLSDRMSGILELYTIVFPARHCSQSAIYDVLYDVVYGKPEEVLWAFNVYQTAWGYPPLPGFESLPAEKVVDTGRSRFRLYRVLPKLKRYDIKETPTFIV